MSSNNETITVRILDREFHVMSPVEEHDQLLRAARFLDERMREIRKGGRIVGQDRIAVMAALNISYELLSATGADDEALEAFHEQLQGLEDRIDTALADSEQPELLSEA